MIEWMRAATADTTAVCPVCSAHTGHTTALVVDNLFVPGDRLHFVRCRTCDSLWVREGNLVEYTDQNAITPQHARHYLHVGAGIDFMVRPLERVRVNKSQSLLDVGCGYGFTLDYWRAVTGSSAIGVEPSGYGRMGRDQLGADIHDCYLADVAELRDRLFDVVYSSEVIEHVADPAAFLVELRQCMAADGVVVLTTPSAEYVNQDAEPSVILAVLSPGLHKLLFSAPALEQLLKRVGFGYVQVEVHGERLVAFAANGPLHITDGAAAHGRYVEYLMKRADAPALPTDLHLGLAFRAFKELVNDGRMMEATRYRDIYADLVKQSSGLDALSGVAGVMASRDANHFATYAAQLPYCHGVFLFYLAMHCRHSGDGLREAAGLFETAEQVLAASIDMAPEYFQEAATLVSLARFERGSALLAAGDRDRAIGCFDELINRTNQARFSGAAPTEPRLRLRAIQQRGIAYLQLGKQQNARDDFAVVLASAAASVADREQAQQLLCQVAQLT